MPPSPHWRASGRMLYLSVASLFYQPAHPISPTGRTARAAGDLCGTSICGSRRAHELRSQPERGVASAWALHGPRAQGRKACGLAGGAGQQVRACDQSPDRPDARPHGTADAARAGRRGDRMKRREFISLLGSAAAWPLAARAQQAALPVVGYLNFGGSPESDTPRLTGLRRGLNQSGYVEGRNLVIEYRWAGNQADRLSTLAT